MTSLEGALLAGGESRRMGRDKALLPFAGRLMIERIAERIAPVVGRLRIVGGEGLGRRYPLEVVADLRPGLGPLSGIHAGLATADADAVLFVPCDLPFVTTEVLREIASALDETVDASVPLGPRGSVPVCAAYRVRCLPALESYLEGGKTSARGLLSRLRVRWIAPDTLRRVDPSGRAFLNVNTPEAYKEALSLAEAEE